MLANLGRRQRCQPERNNKFQAGEVVRGTWSSKLFEFRLPGEFITIIGPKSIPESLETKNFWWVKQDRQSVFFTITKKWIVLD